MPKHLTSILDSVPSLPACHRAHAVAIDLQLSQGRPWQSLKGCRLHRNREMIRFRLGLNWRLVYRCKGEVFEPVAIVTRQNFDHLVSNARRLRNNTCFLAPENNHDRK